MTTDEDLGALVERVAETIAESRYTGWDSHAHPPLSMSWEAYRVADPAVAEGIYLTDARRDAVAVVPVVLAELTA